MNPNAPRRRSSVGTVLESVQIGRGRANTAPPKVNTKDSPPPKQPSLEDQLFQGISQLARNAEDLDKDKLYNDALVVARRDGLEAALAWASKQVPVDSAVKKDFVEAVFDKAGAKFDTLQQTFNDDRRIEGLHRAFGGKGGLSAVKRILKDVCRDDVRKLKQFMDALDAV